MPEINVKNYVFNRSVPATPKPENDINKIDTLEELDVLRGNYQTDVNEYLINLGKYFETKQYLNNRFKKDALAHVGFATIDIQNNTYTEDYYAEKYWNVATKSLNFSKINDMQKAISNLTELYQLFLDKDNNEFSNESLDPVQYDERSLVIDGTTYVIENPNTLDLFNGIAGSFDAVLVRQDGATLSHNKNSNRWELKENGVVTKYINDFDFDFGQYNWVDVTEES